MFDHNSLRTPSDLISQILRGAVGHLDIPADLRAAATAEYQRVGNWLAAHDDLGTGWIVHPQGSFLLNTVVLPRGTDEYDVDTVCRREIAKESTTQATLKLEVGEALDDYLRATCDFPNGPLKREEGKRCWTLLYRRRQRFHLDVLPAIPDPESHSGSLLITDRKLHRWQRSNPLAYAEWFKSRAAAEFFAKRAAIAEAEHTAPAAIPEWEVKTTLHALVQVLKLHRNHHFRDEPKLRPASILITTLASHVYRGEQVLYDALLESTTAMPDHIQRTEEGVYVVSNPVEPRENFADRWQDRPELRRAFFGWLDQLREDLREAASTRGLDHVTARLQESFGEEPVEKAAGDLGDVFRRRREGGALGLAPATGILSTGKSAIPVRSHEFYGRAHRR